MNNNFTHWKVVRPIATHFQLVSCIEYNCAKYWNGWKTTVPIKSDAAEYMRRLGKEYREERNQPGFIDFIFAPGQECFDGMTDTHRNPVERDSVFLCDSRSLSGPEWLEGMNETLYKIRRVRNG
tara:strand:+ start:100 stop:471 length:372 start_codon:yes stop_codon:yes gene_type:complete